MNVRGAEHVACDVLIIGCGLAGMRAAEECSAAGLRVVLLGTGRGASPFIHGFNVPLAPGDSVECFYEDTVRSGCDQGDPALVRILCRGSMRALEGIEWLGSRPNRDRDGNIQLIRAVGCSYPRVVSIGNEAGAVLLERLQERIGRRGNTVFLHGRALRLCVEDSRAEGAVASVGGKIVSIAASAVIGAWGGFAGMFPFNTNPPGSSGSGVGMLHEAGVTLRDLEFIQFEPCVAVWPAPLRGKGMITTLFHEGAVLRNAKGERFCDETAEKDVLAKDIGREIASGGGTGHGAVWFDATAVGRARLEEVYASYVQRYARVGIDIAKQWFEVAPAPHTTLGGAVIAPDCSTNVEGLFVCGEAAGGIHGANRIGGNAGLETLVFGAIAGQSARSYVQSHSSRGEIKALSFLPAGKGNLPALCTELGRRMADGLGMLRNDSSLQALADWAESAAAEIGEGSPEEMALRKDLIAACLTARSALMREESVGCHRRSDFPSRSARRYTVMAGRDQIRREFREES